MGLPIGDIPDHRILLLQIKARNHEIRLTFLQERSECTSSRCDVRMHIDGISPFLCSPDDSCEVWRFFCTREIAGWRFKDQSNLTRLRGLARRKIATLPIDYEHFGSSNSIRSCHRLRAYEDGTCESGSTPLPTDSCTIERVNLNTYSIIARGERSVWSTAGRCHQPSNGRVKWSSS